MSDIIKTIYLLEVDTSVPNECNCSEVVAITDNKGLANAWNDGEDFFTTPIEINELVNLEAWGFSRKGTTHVKAYNALLKEYNESVRI